jgi:hypothetical protein
MHFETITMIVWENLLKVLRWDLNLIMIVRIPVDYHELSLKDDRRVLIVRKWAPDSWQMEETEGKSSLDRTF